MKPINLYLFLPFTYWRFQPESMCLVCFFKDDHEFRSARLICVERLDFNLGVGRGSRKRPGLAVEEPIDHTLDSQNGHQGYIGDITWKGQILGVFSQ